MRPVKVRPRWRCDFCSHTSSSVPGMEAHERRCWKNPNRICDSCGNTGVIKTYVHYYPELPPMEEPCYWCRKYDPDLASLSPLGYLR